jgi:hypothetical protein
MAKASPVVERLVRKARTDLVSGILVTYTELPVNANGKLNDELLFDTGEVILIPRHYGFDFDIWEGRAYTVKWEKGILTMTEGITAPAVEETEEQPF